MIKPFLSSRRSFAAKLITLLIVTMICLSALFDWQLINMQKKNYRASHGTYGLSLVRMLAHTIRLAVFFENEEFWIVLNGIRSSKNGYQKDLGC